MRAASGPGAHAAPPRSKGDAAGRKPVFPADGAKTSIALALVVAAGVWLRARALSAPFFADDYLFLDQARHRSLLETLASPDPLGNFFRPVSRQLWFWCLSAASGQSAAAFHAANLVLMIAILLLLFTLIRRGLGTGPALAGTALLAVHHALDVPVLWACGNQDLLAVTGALAAVLLHREGRRLAAAAAFALALLSKETVVLTPFIAAMAARRGHEPWRAAAMRTWPLFAVLLAWGATWFVTLARRPAMSAEVKVGAEGFPAAFVHLLQTAIAFEWPRAGLASWDLTSPPLALALIAVGIAIAAPGRPRTASRAPGERRRALLAGAGWAFFATLPAVAVAGIWSAYYYLYAMCGVALLFAALVASRPWWVALLPVLAVGWASDNVRRMPEFSRSADAWSWQSHVNRHYIERGMSVVFRFLEDLRRQRPQLPPRTTLFFTGVPAQVAFQAADGPLVRWAYGDSTLRSYFLNRFRSEHATRGPVFFFQVHDDSLREIVGGDSLERIGFSLVVSEQFDAARDAFALAWARDPSGLYLAYRLAWVEAARGDSAATRGWLTRSRVSPVSGPAPEVPQAFARIEAGDTTAALALAQSAVAHHGLDPGAHALLADLLLVRPATFRAGALEAFAARLLAPGDAWAWRRWGFVQAIQGRNTQAREALERYLALAGEQARNDVEAHELLREIRRKLPGGDLAQEDLRRTLPTRK